MGFFDFLFKRKPRPQPQPESPEALRERLFDAAAREDLSALEQLCQEHAQEIATRFPTWRKVPEALRADEGRTRWYAEGLIAVARVFAERLGRPELLKLLESPGVNANLERWKHALAEARREMQGLQFDRAEAFLAREVPQLRSQRGPAIERMLAITLGSQGECLFQLGRAREALPLVREALELCRSMADHDGVLAYLGTLYELHRYLGEGQEAAGHAAELARFMTAAGSPHQARHFERLARLARDGEPLNRVVVHLGEQIYELDEVPALSEGSLKFSFARNRPTLARATALTAQGAKQGSLGQLAESRASFESAAALDPYDPAPVYQLGVVLMDQERPAEAAERFQAVETLAPGWFQCRADLWLARRIASKQLPYEAYIMLRALESYAPPDQKVALIRRAVEQLPELAPLHLALAEQCIALGQPDEARAACDRGLACAEDPDVRTRLLVSRAFLEPEHSSGRVQRLEQAVALDGNRVSAAMAKVALQNAPNAAN